LHHYVAFTGRHRPRPRRVLPPAPALRHAIEFRDVWFRYPDTESWALRGVSLQLSAGNSTALVGVNGSGKSTLVALLCGLQKPTRGTILWDGVDIGHFEPDSLRRRVRAVFQDFVKYEFTAGENIGFGDVERLRDDDAIGRAARLAGVAATVEALPRGYGTQLSHMFALSASKRQHVASLSGGQWQRLAVARALMRDDVDVLILDEPSTGLDAESEASLHERLRAHRRGRCSLLISHRLSAVKCAALIVVLEHGAIVESGSHTELLRSSGIYAKMRCSAMRTKIRKWTTRLYPRPLARGPVDPRQHEPGEARPGHDAPMAGIHANWFAVPQDNQAVRRDDLAHCDALDAYGGQHAGPGDHALHEHDAVVICTRGPPGCTAENRDDPSGEE